MVGDDTANSVFAWLRSGPDARPVLVVANMTPLPVHDYRVGVPVAGHWRELLNSDAADYGGSGLGNEGGVGSEAVASHGHPFSLVLTLPPMASLILAL